MNFAQLRFVAHWLRASSAIFSAGATKIVTHRDIHRCHERGRERAPLSGAGARAMIRPIRRVSLAEAEVRLAVVVLVRSFGRNDVRVVRSRLVIARARDPSNNSSSSSNSNNSVTLVASRRFSSSCSCSSRERRDRSAYWSRDVVRREVGCRISTRVVSPPSQSSQSSSSPLSSLLSFSSSSSSSSSLSPRG